MFPTHWSVETFVADVSGDPAWPSYLLVGAVANLFAFAVIGVSIASFLRNVSTITSASLAPATAAFERFERRAVTLVGLWLRISEFTAERIPLSNRRRLSRPTS